MLFFGGGADDAPDLFDAFVEGDVVEVAEVGDEVGGEVVARDFAHADKDQELVGITRSAAERGEGVAALIGC